jgi:class 3 adenylate cyclase
LSAQLSCFIALATNTLPCSPMSAVWCGPPSGLPVSVTGDDLFAVFERAPGALGAALAIQRGMHAGAWPGGTDVRLRIGLHRGRPALTNTGYVGLSVHTVARICFAAHGGQIVMSSAVREAVPESLGDGVSLRSLGAWRFRGLPEQVALLQVDADDLLADFPPPRSAVRAGSNEP